MSCWAISASNIPASFTIRASVQSPATSLPDSGSPHSPSLIIQNFFWFLLLAFLFAGTFPWLYRIPNHPVPSLPTSYIFATIFDLCNIQSSLVPVHDFFGDLPEAVPKLQPWFMLKPLSTRSGVKTKMRMWSLFVPLAVSDCAPLKLFYFLKEKKNNKNILLH